MTAIVQFKIICSIYTACKHISWLGFDLASPKDRFEEKENPREQWKKSWLMVIFKYM